MIVARIFFILKNLAFGEPEVPILSRHGHEAHGSQSSFRLIGRTTIALWLTPVVSSRRVEHGTIWHGNVNSRRLWTIIYSEWDHGAKVVRSDRRPYGFSDPQTEKSFLGSVANKRRKRRAARTVADTWIRSVISFCSTVIRCCKWKVYRAAIRSRGIFVAK